MIAEKLSELFKKNIRLWTEDGKLKFKASAGVLTGEDKEFLKANKEEIINYLLNDEIKIEIDKEHQYEPFGMTEIQQAYVLGRNPAFEYGGTACHIYMELEYDSLDTDKVQSVWNKLIKRHNMLHAVMSVDGYQQILHDVPEFNVEVVECDSNNEAEKRAAIKSELDHKIYDTSKFPLFSVVVSKGTTKDIMHFSIEFVTADWSSIWTVLSEFESLYFNPEKELPQLELTFRDYLIAEKKLRQGSKYYRDKEYWLDRIDNLPSAPELPVLSVKDNNEVRFERSQFSISKEKWDKFCATAKKLGVTPASSVMTAYGMAIARWSRNKSFCLNLSILNRLELHPEVSSIIGDFTASSLLEVEHKKDSCFRDIVVQTNQRLFDDLDHRLFTGVNVLREIQQRKGTSLMPYVFTGAIGLISPEKSRLKGKMNNNGISQTPQVFMDCQAMDTAEGLNINIDYRAGIFPENVVNDICGVMQSLLEKLSEDESFWIKAPFRIDLPEWQKEVRKKVNDTHREQRKYLLHEKVIEQLEKNPEAFAVADSETSWTCAELYSAVKNTVAELKKKGVGKGDFVAVAIPKSRWQIVACLAILASGGAYVPLDVNSAEKRSETVLEKISAKCVLEVSNKKFSVPEKYQVIEIDTIEDGDCGSLVNNPANNELTDTAYIIFTSGSTGEPKGVTMSHGAAVNTIEAINRMFDINSDDRVFNLSQLNFDLSVYDIFGVIGEGGGIVIPDHSQYKNPAHWVEMMDRYKVTVWNSVPALMQLLLIYHSYNKEREINPLKVVMLSGDWIAPEQPDKLKELFPGVRVISLGGATEGGIWSIYHECNSEYDSKPEWKSIPYGKPLPNQTFKILDSFLQDCPVWVQGELFITGESLATSYFGEDELTGNSFFGIDGTMAYRTGDTGCYHPDGEIEFLGRTDNQVKIRGHRIELGEIEAVIRKQFDIENVSCIVYESNQEKKLVAVIAEDIEIDEKILESRLEKWLPAYMIPSAVVKTDIIPLTTNGKVDRKKLNEIVDNSMKNDKVKTAENEQMNETEKSVHDVMTEVLGVEIGLDENFYEAGANSLILARVAGKLNQTVEKSIPFDTYLVKILNMPTVRAVAKIIDEARAKTETISVTETAETGLAWNRNNSNELCVVFIANLRTDIIEKLKNADNKNYLFVAEKMNISEVSDEIIKAEPEVLTILASDYELADSLRTASVVMEQGVMPEKVNILESDTENEVSIDVVYMGDLKFGITTSDTDSEEDIRSILEEYCMGDIEVADCRTDEQIWDFIG